MIGTSGYDYNDWKGGFYPEKLTKTKFLEYYSQHFNSLELNGTYYRMPTAEQMQKMIDRTEKRVQFTVKAYQGITHDILPTEYHILTGDFKKALEPLQKENLLLCALLQFPERFHYTNENRVYLDLLIKELKDIPLVVEMRNNKWQNANVYNALRERNVGWCITDNPEVGRLLKQEFITTSDIAYMRFHGRNKEMWYKGDNVTRYDYLYSDSELRNFVHHILEMLKNSKIVQLFFNNHAKSQATINAKKIELLLKEASANE